MKRLLLALVLLGPVGAVAQFYSSNVLQELCVGTDIGAPNDSMSKYNDCTVYLAGIADAASAFSDWHYKDTNGAPFGSCIPDGVYHEQLRLAWLKYASKYPERVRHVIAAASLVLNAFEKAWPCKR
jgi:hypothetical protein